MPERLINLEPITNSGLVAYSDETGNTGNHIFDKDQPYFWCGTLLIEGDFEADDESDILNWLSLVSDDEYRERVIKRRLNPNELHGNELGLGRIEKFAERYTQLIKTKNIRFVFTRIEKKHIAPTKFTDVLLDSGINKAVSPIHYNVRAMRLPLALILTEHLSPQSQELFWQAYEKGDERSFQSILERVRWNVRNKVHDKRLREILIDAIDWAQKNPKPLLEATRSELDAPNIVALSLLVSYLHKVSEETGKKVTKFIHDQQNQFAKAMQKTFEALKEIAISATPTSFMPEVKHLDTYQCPLTIAASHSLVGLQLIDVALWLTKRWIEKPWPEKNGCSTLAEEILSRSAISEFSRRQLEDDSFEAIAYLNSQPVTDDQMVAGMELFKEMEAKRQRRMNEN